MHINKSGIIIIALIAIVFVSSSTRISCRRKPTPNTTETKKLTSEKMWCRERQKLIITERNKFPRSQWLRSYRIIIDPGHGVGGDPGAVRQEKTKDGKTITVYESNTVWDVALRLSSYVKKSGGAILITVTNSITQRVDYPTVTKDPITNHTLVVDPKNIGDHPKLHCRCRVANQACEKYSDKKVIFISLHFDSNPRKELGGITFYTHPKDKETRLIPYLMTAAHQYHRERKLNGEEYYPSRNAEYYVINPAHNAASNRVLVELGNLQNDADFWRMRDALVKEDYAKTITQGIIFYVKSLKKK